MLRITHLISTLLAGSIVLVGLSFPATATAENNFPSEKIDRFLEAMQAAGDVPGFAVAVVDREGVRFAKGYGAAGDGQAVTGDTPFAIASLSKAFTALAVMQLVEAGSIGLEDEIGKYIPPLAGKGITVRSLLNQTSGLSDIVYPEMSFSQQPATLEEAANRMADVTPVNVPGAKFHYHNPNYSLLARLVEVVSGQDFSAYLQTHIFQPLQMRHTANVALTKEFSAVPGFTPGYSFLFGYPRQMQEPDWFVNGSAGMVSTANDMAQWLCMFLNEGVYEDGRLLSDEGIRLMETAPDGIRSWYGMGWGTYGKDVLNHNGLLWTYLSEQQILTDKGYGIIVLLNGGLNMSHSSSPYIAGITSILRGGEAEVPTLSARGIGMMIAGALALYVCICIWLLSKRSKQTKKQQRLPLLILQCAGLLLPLLILVLLPQAVTVLGNRPLSWERIWLTMPDIILFLGIVSFFNLLLIIKKIIRLTR